MNQDYRPLETEAGRVWSTLPADALAAYVEHQVAHLFPDGFTAPAGAWLVAVSRALAALARCFSRIAIAGYTKDGEAALSHLHGDRYAVFLALLAREFHRDGDIGLACRTYLLNKALHGLDLFYEVELPEVFLLVHPVGTVIGRAKLGNFLCVYQNCTIGGTPLNGTLEYPRLGTGTILFARSTLIGRCDLGDGVVMGAGSMLVNASAPAGSLITGDKVHEGAASVGRLMARFFIDFRDDRTVPME
ncbi:MAG: hypothetical protein L6Q38_13625 [Nitrospira sp.]|nr:hypothetical protein [Nitrospira sp.]